jgi:hypothetical protein
MLAIARDSNLKMFMAYFSGAVAISIIFRFSMYTFSGQEKSW